MPYAFQILESLLPIGGGIYVILIFGGFYTPKIKDEGAQIRLEKTIKKRGKLLVLLGILMILLGAGSLYLTLS